IAVNGMTDKVHGATKLRRPRTEREMKSSRGELHLLADAERKSSRISVFADFRPPWGGARFAGGSATPQPRTSSSAGAPVASPGLRTSVGKSNCRRWGRIVDVGHPR